MPWSRGDRFVLIYFRVVELRCKGDQISTVILLEDRVNKRGERRGGEGRGEAGKGGDYITIGQRCGGIGISKV